MFGRVVSDVPSPKARERELANLDADRRAVGMLDVSYARKKRLHVPHRGGARDDTCDDSDCCAAVQKAAEGKKISYE